MVATYLISILCLFFWPFIQTTGAAIAFVVVFGAISGTVIGLPPASVAYILDESGADPARLGQWVGMMYSGAAIPALIGPVAVGALIISFNDYLTVQLWSGLCFFLSGTFMALSRWYLVPIVKERRMSEATAVSQHGRLQSMSTLTPMETPRRSLDRESKKDMDA